MGFILSTISHYLSTKITIVKNYFHSTNSKKSQLAIKIKTTIFKIPGKNTMMLSGLVLLDCTPLGLTILMLGLLFRNRNQIIITRLDQWVRNLERFSFVFFLLDSILTVILLLTNSHFSIRIYTKTFNFALILMIANAHSYKRYLKNPEKNKPLLEHLFALIMSLFVFYHILTHGNQLIKEFECHQGSPTMIADQPLRNALRAALFEQEKHKNKPNYKDIENRAENWEELLQVRETDFPEQYLDMKLIEKSLTEERVPGETLAQREQLYETTLDQILTSQEKLRADYETVDTVIGQYETSAFGEKIPVPDRLKKIDQRLDPKLNDRVYRREFGGLEKIKRPGPLSTQVVPPLEKPLVVAVESHPVPPSFKEWKVVGVGDLKIIPPLENQQVIGMGENLEMLDWTEALNVIEVPVPAQEQKLVNPKDTKTGTTTTGLTRKRKARVGRLSDLPKLPDDGTNLSETNTPRVAIPPEKVR